MDNLTSQITETSKSSETVLEGAEAAIPSDFVVYHLSGIIEYPRTHPHVASAVSKKVLQCVEGCPWVIH